VRCRVPLLRVKPDLVEISLQWGTLRRVRPLIDSKKIRLLSVSSNAALVFPSRQVMSRDRKELQANRMFRSAAAASNSIGLSPPLTRQELGCYGFFFFPSSFNGSLVSVRSSRRAAFSCCFSLRFCSC